VLRISRAWRLHSQSLNAGKHFKGASYDERWLALKRNLFLFLAGWLAGTTEPSISNVYLSPVHHDEQKALATTGMPRILPQLRQKLTAMVQEMVQVGP
jgi:hypothetical protein